MRHSQLFAKIKREAPKGAEVISHKYLVRADFISQSFAGVYRFLPLGKKVLEKIKGIIREEMLELGAQEVELPALQNKSLWLKTGRWHTIDPPLFKFKDRRGKELALGSTHEEDITDIFGGNIKTPLYLFQIQTKFRNEMRPTGGLLRTREFLMKDLYSFHEDEKDFNQFYEKVKKSYFKIFKRCGLKPICCEADPGTIGGDFSHEFMVLSPAGEDEVRGKKAIEVGHVFSLGHKYSKAMLQKHVIMGCYGIGISRLMAAIVEKNHDEKGIIWPEEVAPFDVHLLDLGQKQESERAYKDLQKQDIDVLYDDREAKTAGEKFAEADLIGIPIRLVVSERTIKQNAVEMKRRNEQKTKLISYKHLSKLTF